METEHSQGLFERILFCTDFSSNADFAFSYALSLAKMRAGSTLFLLHVVPESDAQFWKSYIYEVENVEEKARQDIEERLERTYRAQVPSFIRFEAIFRVGRDWQEILATASEKQADLIVMGRRSQSSLQKAFFGNLTEKVARQAPCSVLIIPLSYQEMVSRRGERSSTGG